MTKRYGLFIGCLALLAAVECLLTPAIALLQDNASFFLPLLFYPARLLAFAAPFLTLGAIFEGWRQSGFRRFLLYFLPFLFIDLAAQVPLSLLAYYNDLLYSFGSILLSYTLSSASLSAVILLIALLCFFLFFFKRDTLVSHAAFFTVKSSDGRAAAVAAAVVALYLLVTEAIGIVEDAAARLWIIDGIDLLNYLFSLIFAAVCGFACYAFARLGGRLVQE